LRRNSIVGIGASIFIALVLFSLAADAYYVWTFGPGYNPSQACQTAIQTTIATLWANNTFTAIFNKRALNPPCASYVELDNVRVQAGSIEIGFSQIWGSPANYDCALFWSGIWCDSSFNVVQGNQWVHVEIDKNWKANNIAPKELPLKCQNGCTMNLKGFVYWDNVHVVANNGNGWEIHPLASWNVTSY
jgi:hypothetical protein